MYTPVVGSNKTFTASSIESVFSMAVTSSCSGVSGNILFNSSIPGSCIKLQLISIIKVIKIALN